MTDIVDRLREQLRTRTLPMWLEISDAADEIERLRAENKRLQEQFDIACAALALARAALAGGKP